MGARPLMAITIDLSGQVALVTGGTKGVGRGIAQRFADAGASIAVCSRSEPESALPDGWEWFGVDLRDGEAAWAMVDSVVERLGRARRAREQRRRRAAGRLHHREAAVHRAHHRVQPVRGDLLLATRQPLDAAAGHRRVDRQHRQRERAAPDAPDRGVRRGQGRARELHADHRGGVGAEGAGQPRDRGDGAHRAVAPLLRRRGGHRQGRLRPCRSVASPTPTTSATRACSSRHRSPPTSAAPTSPSTAAANPLPTSTSPPSDRTAVLAWLLPR